MSTTITPPTPQEVDPSESTPPSEPESAGPSDTNCDSVED